MNEWETVTDVYMLATALACAYGCSNTVSLVTRMLDKGYKLKLNRVSRFAYTF